MQGSYKWPMRTTHTKITNVFLWVFPVVWMAVKKTPMVSWFWGSVNGSNVDINTVIIYLGSCTCRLVCWVLSPNANATRQGAQGSSSDLMVSLQGKQTTHYRVDTCSLTSSLEHALFLDQLCETERALHHPPPPHLCTWGLFKLRYLGLWSNGGGGCQTTDLVPCLQAWSIHVHVQRTCACCRCFYRVDPGYETKKGVPHLVAQHGVGV